MSGVPRGTAWLKEMDDFVEKEAAKVGLMHPILSIDLFKTCSHTLECIHIPVHSSRDALPHASLGENRAVCFSVSSSFDQKPDTGPVFRCCVADRRDVQGDERHALRGEGACPYPTHLVEGY